MRRFRFLLLATTLCDSLAGWAQVPDPTRPAGYPIESGVQTVILRPEGKSAAIVFGEYVEVGGRIGDRRVVNITESAVTLAGEKGVEVIRVMSSVEKVAKPRASGVRKTMAAQEAEMSGKAHR
jgi:hypothetical protein